VHRLAFPYLPNGLHPFYTLALLSMPALIYDGPLRSEPLAIELHNTVYAAAGRPIDGLADAASGTAFLAALAPRLPRGLPPGPPPSRAQLVALRGPIRAALGEALDDTPHDHAALAAITRSSAAAPASPGIVAGSGIPAVAVTDYHGARRADIVLAAFAADAIDLLAGPRRAGLRRCGAPGCVLIYLTEHPRRQWCSNACGNRARQARHYRRTRERP
jgi:predicted RNA-binding Zn ribbon-like protein